MITSSKRKNLSADAFIAGQSGVPAPKTIRMAGKKNIISVSISPDVLARLDTWATAHGMSRAAAIAYACSTLAGAANGN